jgi:uncharacterized protein (TIGR02145 family)
LAPIIKTTPSLKKHLIMNFQIRFVLLLLIIDCGFTFAQSDSSIEVRYHVLSIKDSIVDSRDMNVYKTIKLNNQIWLSENLRYKPDYGKYWCPENDTSAVKRYGYLYNWETAQNVCPCGFRIPSKEDFEELLMSIGNDNSAIKLTKSNDIGFNALFVGAKYGLNYVPYGYGVAFWTSNSRTSIYAWGFGIGPKDKNVVFGPKFTKKSGLTIRCMKNDTN